MAFAGIRRRNHNGTGHHACAIKFLFIANRAELTVRGQLAFELQPCLFEVFAEMHADIERVELNAILRGINLALLGVLAFEVGFLVV